MAGAVSGVDSERGRDQLDLRVRGRHIFLRGLKGTLRRLLLGRLTGVTLGLIAVCIYFWATEPTFMTWANWQNMIRVQGVAAILAIGMTFVLLTGGIDLSIASMTAAAGMVMGLAIQHGWAWETASLACIGAGIVMGSLNGFLIGVAKIPFFVVTLGTLAIYQSFARLVTPGSQTITLFSYQRFTPLADLINGKVGPFPNLLILVAGLYVLGAIVLRYSKFGYAVYAVGSNRQAARLAGIRVTLALVSVYTISGLLAGVAAIVHTGQLSASTPDADPTLIFTVAAAVLIGGTAFTGGDGGLLGTAIGIVFLGVVENGLLLSDVSQFWQGAVSGLILIAAVGIGVLRDYVRRLTLARIRLRRTRSLPEPPRS
jgi:ribose transport system permease protein